MSRRVDSVGTGLFWRSLEENLRRCGHPGLLAFVDGKPLPVSGYSKDPDARWGRGAGGLAKGFKLHAVWSRGVLPETWDVRPLNVSEKEVAHHLIGQLQPAAISSLTASTMRVTCTTELLPKVIN